MKIYEYTLDPNPVNDTITIIADLTSLNAITASNYSGTSITNIWTNVDFAFTTEEGSPSDDHRYWAFIVGYNTGAPFWDNVGLGLIVYDLVLNNIISVYDFAIDGGGVGNPNNVSMSPSGKYVLAVWNPPNGTDNTPPEGTFNNPMGMMSFNRDLTTAVALMNNGEHVDTAIDTSGNDVIISICYSSYGNADMNIINMSNGTIISTIIPGAWDGAGSYSGRALDYPGWALVSMYANSSNLWWHNRIFAVKLDNSGTIVMLADHYSTAVDYWDQPHATVSRNFERILFGTDWGNGAVNSDSYIITLPIDPFNGL